MGKKVIKITKETLKEIISKEIKQVLSETYTLSDLDELMEFLWLRPSRTGLNVDIFVDDGGSYKRHNHQLLLFARNGYDKSVSEFISFLVSKKPLILNPTIEYNISYNDIFAVQDFIQLNLDGLTALADEAISHQEFVKSLKIPS